MLSQEVKIWKQKCQEVEKGWKGKILSLEEEKKVVEEGKRELGREVEELKRRIVGYQGNEASNEKRLRQVEDSIGQKVRKIDQL